MNAKLCCGRTLTFALLCMSLLGVSAAGQESDFSLKDWQKAIESALKEDQDQVVAAQIKALQREFESLEDGDKKKAVKSVEKALSKRRPEDDNGLYITVLEALPSFGEPAETACLKALRHRNIKDRPKVMKVGLQALGLFQNPKHIKVFEDYLVHKDTDVVAGAVRGLGEFHAAKETYRKSIVGDLVRNYSTLYSNTLGTPPGQRQAGQPVKRPDTKRYEALRGAYEQALAKLTGQKIQGATSWMRWYNDNRKKRWSK